ncbi:nuclear transport factor 2 family protein [Streptomyces griseus]|uniref:nuclear transport factor 2 family protein n=1 Tax=Streptomyces griseus TaxID=1911 RepID=UPI003864FEBC|nr:nuclear transport factor 2 family protein [Streptomyces fimicarius]
MTHSPTTDSRAVLTAMYTAEARYLAAGGPGTASFDLLAPCFAPDVVLQQAAALPYGGVWRGHRGMERFFLAMSDIWATFELVEQDFLATGEISVVHTIVRARSRATRRELTFPILQTLTVRDGRISEIRPFYWDTDAVVRACAP